jgi:hypothetical protein
MKRTGGLLRAGGAVEVGRLTTPGGGQREDSILRTGITSITSQVVVAEAPTSFKLGDVAYQKQKLNFTVW